MIKLKQMEKSDISICGTIHYEAFFGRLQKALLEKEPQAAKDFFDSFDFGFYFSRYIDCSDKYAYCICNGGEIVGYITALELPTFGGDCIIYIDSIAVSPKHQKQKYGKAALEQFAALFPESTVFRLLTDKQRPAFKMYESLGFMDMEMVVMEKSRLLSKINRFIQPHNGKQASGVNDSL